MLEEEEDLSAATVARPMLAASLGQGSITAPNLASLMLHVQAPGGKTILLTGDGSSEDVLAGLEATGRIDPGGHLHVNALKVQHHGALANVTEEFVRRVTADHYIFCGNGAHHNPELEVVEAFALARLGNDQTDAIGPATPFTFWFSSRSTSPNLSDSRRRHMREVEDLVGDLRRDHDPGRRFTFELLKSGHHTIDI